MDNMSDHEHAHEMQHRMPMPQFNQLHVVLHGMICVRLSYQTRTVQLHFPSVPMHDYHFGSFDNPKPLPYGHDYQLGGVRVGDFEPNNTKLKTEHTALCLSERQIPGKPLTCVPRGTQATVTLPWPQGVTGVRMISNPPPGIFLNTDVNPQSLYYIAYLTYLVDEDDVPVLTKCCDDELWAAPDPTAKHTRLHFYADPFRRLNKELVPAHLSDAFGRLNDQCFGGNFPLIPNVPPFGFQFRAANDPIIPNNEAQDFDPQPKDGKSEHLFDGGTGGNCFQAVILD
jgi:hypothetical protein